MNAELFVEKLRAAHRKRAEYMYFIYQEMCADLDQAQAEKIMRRALAKAGAYYGKQMADIQTPADFIAMIEGGNPPEIFGRQVLQKTDQVGAFSIGHCPLVDAWQRMELSREEVDLLCDIAMDTDRGAVVANGMNLEVKQCLTRGDAVCELEVTKQPAG